MAHHDENPADGLTDAERLLADGYRARLGHAPPATDRQAVAAFRASTPAAAGWRDGVDLSRIALLLSGLAGLVLDVPVLVGAAAHTTQDVATLHVALAVGLLVAAWRPERFATGLAPVVAVASVLLFLPGVTGAGPAGAAEELSHLPIVLGAASLLLRPVGRGHHASRRAARPR